MKNPPVLIIVDVQRYYLDPNSNFRKFPESTNPSAFEYIETRCSETVLPNIKLFLDRFREEKWPVIYLRLCGQNPDRSDLHYIFRESYEEAASEGYPGIYPLADERMAEIAEEIAPLATETVLDKVTFSGFTSSELEDTLLRINARELVFTGLATSQCVDTTARDASDRGYTILHAEDAQADYSEMSHSAALFASQGVCGGHVYSTEELLSLQRPGNLLL